MSHYLSKLNHWKLPLIALIGLVFTVIVLVGRFSPPELRLKEMPPTSAYNNTIAGVGVVEPKSEIINVGTELTGVVDKVDVIVGQRVTKGQPLFTLDQRDVDSKIKTLEASLAVANLEAADAKVQFDIVSAVTDKHVVPLVDFKHRQYAAALARARVYETMARLEQAKITKQRLTVTAPIDGEILSVDIHPGESTTMVMPIQPLIRLGDTSKLYLRVEFDEEYAGCLNKSSSAMAMKRGDTKLSYPLTFVRFEPYVRPKHNLSLESQQVDSRVVQVIYALNSSKEAIFVGEQVDVFVEKN